ncbi:hypothetical protein HR060_03485 [Catenovulum sp. SM1970]|nr:hypothetical protein [Marinifaba aquimaris]NTS75921.1 hypothetical protein [Marinifaba aquimaris]
MLISACGDPLQAHIDVRTQRVSDQLTNLQQALEKGQVRNATLLQEYADYLVEDQPKLKPIAQALAQEATVNGSMYKGLVDRFVVAKSNPNAFVDSQERLDELDNLYMASQTSLFNDALSDPVNVLADMSQGALSRVNSISREAAIAANGASDFGVGEQLIGNPAYGSWQTGNDGLSFWEWYAIFAMIDIVDDMIDRKRRPTYYHNWSRGRSYSYYHDYGRVRYSSPTQLKNQYKTESRVKKQFGSGSFTSAYSKTRTGGSKMSAASRTSQAASKQFSSNYSRTGSSTFKSNYSNNSSFRSNKGGSSRGGFGGK